MGHTKLRLDTLRFDNSFADALYGLCLTLSASIFVVPCEIAIQTHSSQLTANNSLIELANLPLRWYLRFDCIELDLTLIILHPGVECTEYRSATGHNAKHK
jgi:hypothetical protein